MSLTDSLGRLQETNMLTEQGLYKILMISRKPIAKDFQKWVFNIIKEIRLNSNKQLENKIKQLEFHKEPSFEIFTISKKLFIVTVLILKVFLKLVKLVQHLKNVEMVHKHLVLLI